MFKKIILFLFVVFIIIQFFRPAKNIATEPDAFAHDISTIYSVPDSIHEILEASCYDCHSNNTHYPWYNNVQPVAWWLSHHINNGKHGLNFSEFASYRIGKQYRRFGGIIKEIKSGGMPLSSYTLIHRYAILSTNQKNMLSDWATQIMDSIKVNTPADSLAKR